MLAFNVGLTLPVTELKEVLERLPDFVEGLVWLDEEEEGTRESFSDFLDDDGFNLKGLAEACGVSLWGLVEDFDVDLGCFGAGFEMAGWSDNVGLTCFFTALKGFADGANFTALAKPSKIFFGLGARRFGDLGEACADAPGSVAGLVARPFVFAALPCSTLAFLAWG